MSAGAFSSQVAADADMRVVITSELRLVPGREDPTYVTEDDDGQLEVTIDSLNRNANTAFERLIRIINEGDLSYDELHFSFSPHDEDDPDADQAEALIEIISAEREVDEENGDFIILADSEETLDPGDDLRFGIAVEFLSVDDPPDLSDGVELALTITAVRR